MDTKRIHHRKSGLMLMPIMQVIVDYLRDAYNLCLAGIHCKYIDGFTDYLEFEYSVEALFNKGLKD
jgi:hypothetical protein